MNLLLDTHTLIWFLNGDIQLSKKARIAVENSDNLKMVSIASIWEIAIKISIGKFSFEPGFESFLNMIDENGFELLPITLDHALVLSTLAFIHRDPFDRLLVAQCLADKLVLISKDQNIQQYDIETLW